MDKRKHHLLSVEVLSWIIHTIKGQISHSFGEHSCHDSTDRSAIGDS